MSSKPKAHGSTETETTSTQAGRGEISAGNSAREEEIRRRAYEIYLEGGEQPGRELTIGCRPSTNWNTGWFACEGG